MAKKSFKNTSTEVRANPALSFITEPQTDRKEPERSRAGETKSKRLNLLIKPSIAKDIEKIATMKRVSTNELINTVLEDYRNANSELLEKYNTTFEGVE